VFTKVEVLPLNKEIENQAKSIGMLKRLKEKIELLENNFRHPSLKAKLLEPHNRGLWQIYINRKYRAHFIVPRMLDEQIGEAEIVFVGDPHS